MIFTQSSNQYFYHYTKSSVAIDFILNNRTLRFGSYHKTNDPKESKNWIFNQGSNERRDLSKYTNSELSEWLSTELKEKTKLACFSVDRGNLTGNHLEDICNRGFCKPRMWAQYGDEHHGVCLVFDRQRINRIIEDHFKADCQVLSGQITYRNRSIVPDLLSPDDQQYMINIDHLEKVGRDQYVQDHITTHYKRLFLEKMRDWRDEDEWRYVVFADTNEDLYIDFDNSLIGIMFGASTSDHDVDKMMKITKLWGLKYMGLKWKNCTPWYDFENPRYR